jgi:hypothetical protein
MVRLTGADSQRIGPDTLLDCLVSAFSRSGIAEFRTFLAKHPGVTKWFIASDFVNADPQAASDVYAFTFFPYERHFEQLKAEIRQLVPKDFKKTIDVEPELRQFFHSGATFTICLLTPKKYKVAGSIGAIRRSLDVTISNMRQWRDADRQQKIIGAFERLRERAKANNFNGQLISTIIFATVLAAFCAVMLAKERNIEVVGWYPDRDNITTSYDQIAHYMFVVNFSAFCQRHNIDAHSIRAAIGIPTPDARRPRQTWYDELVRIPDFLAGPLAAWRYEANLVTGRQKYVDLLQGVIADNPNVVTLLLKQVADGFGIGPIRIRHQ